MIRFPLNEEITLITSFGVITAIIKKITSDILILDQVIMQDKVIGDDVYVDKKYVYAYRLKPKKEDKKEFKPLSKIIKFPVKKEEKCLGK